MFIPQAHYFQSIGPCWAWEIAKLQIRIFISHTRLCCLEEQGSIWTLSFEDCIFRWPENAKRPSRRKCFFSIHRKESSLPRFFWIIDWVGCCIPSILNVWHLFAWPKEQKIASLSIVFLEFLACLQQWSYKRLLPLIRLIDLVREPYGPIFNVHWSCFAQVRAGNRFSMLYHISLLSFSFPASKSFSGSNPIQLISGIPFDNCYLQSVGVGQYFLLWGGSGADYCFGGFYGRYGCCMFFYGDSRLIKTRTRRRLKSKRLLGITKGVSDWLFPLHWSGWNKHCCMSLASLGRSSGIALCFSDTLPCVWLLSLLHPGSSVLTVAIPIVPRQCRVRRILLATHQRIVLCPQEHQS